MTAWNLSTVLSDCVARGCLKTEGEYVGLMENTTYTADKKLVLKFLKKKVLLTEATEAGHTTKEKTKENGNFLSHRPRNLNANRILRMSPPIYVNS